MIYVIIGIIIGLYTAITEGWLCDWRDICTNTIATIALPLFCGLCGSVIWIVLGSTIGCFLPTVETKETQELYTLADNYEMYGSFFLCCGSIDEEQHYIYIIKENKGKQVKNIEVDDNVYLNDTIEGTPTLDTYKTVLKYKWMYWFAFSLKDDTYVFNIPSGSIDYKYNIDLE